MSIARTTIPTAGRVCGNGSMAGEESAVAHVQGRRIARAAVRRQGTRCEGYCEARLSAPWTARSPAPGDGHTHKEPAAWDARGGLMHCAGRGLDRPHHH